MKRSLFSALCAWKTKKERKPLILQGARQVGKTFLLKAFGEQEYANVAYFNFELSPKLKSLFSGDINPRNIIEFLSIDLSAPIHPGSTLIIFDEIQECPEALNSLKYFQELANDYHICAAGSLLGVTLANTKGFPVGKVDFLNLYPLSFTEFLEAKNEKQLRKLIDELKTIQPLPELIHEKLLGYFKEYVFVGGMPAAVLEYINTQNYDVVRQNQINILNAYRLDFAKHAPNNLMKINQVWEVIPSQLAKENKKFIYSVIRKGARAQEFEAAIQWLKEAGLIYKAYQCSVPKLPLKAYISHEIFKIYLCDVGLLGAMSDLSAKSIIYGNDIFQEFKGALMENYVAQELVRQGFSTYYWTSSGEAEIDYLLQFEDSIYPVEVKSGTSNKKRSLLSYDTKYTPKLSIRISPMNLKKDGNILNCPLYLIEKLTSFIG
jgi:predicted AAA+ superfamily ATPase